MSVASTQITGYGPTEYPKQSAWAGWIGFAGILLVLLGAWHVLMGLLAIFDDPYFNAPQRGLMVDASYTTWGWVHLVVGVVVAAAGVGVFTGRMWARAVGTVAAVVSAVVCLGFLSAQPFMAAIMIALDVVVILALTVHGAEIKAAG
jgi:uncharacterized membrane protein